MFNTRRGLIKYVLLNIITFGIYGLVVMSHISEEINVLASSRDGRHTMHFLLIAFIFTVMTCGIATLIWWHRISNRIGNELVARDCNYRFGASDFWLWGILGAIILIGPFIYRHKLLKAMNLLNMDYLTNRRNIASSNA